MTMTFQAHDGHLARSEDLHRHILRSHLAYLNLEETPSKLQQRRNLEKLISEFLSVVSHSVRFTFIEISNILQYSVENNPNFSAYKAQSAFEALEKYATNLISHPWRKEFKTVKLYSGFYKHSVEQQLIHAESVFLLLGYQSTEDGVLFLDEPIDPDKVARVALDCLTAFVECQIMVQICESVKSFKCSWAEIYSIREDYACGVEEAVRLLHQLKRNAFEQTKHNHWLRNQENGYHPDERRESSSAYPKTGVLIDVSNTWPSDDKYLNFESSRYCSTSDEPVKTKTTYSRSKLSSWDGVGPVLDDDRGWNVPRSTRTETFTSHSFEDPVRSRYSFAKEANPVSKYGSPGLVPDLWSSSWEELPSALHPSSHSHSDSFQNCDRIALQSFPSQTVPNMKDHYSAQLSHVFSPHSVMPVGVPGCNYPLPHNVPVSLRQCQSRMACESQLPSVPSKHHPKVSLTNSFDSDFLSFRHIDSGHKNESDLLASLSKLSLENPNSKTKNFPVNTPAFAPYQSSNEVKLRSEADKLQSNSCNRGSVYDNVPSNFSSDVVSHKIGSSLNSKCDSEGEGVVTGNLLTLSKPSRSMKGPSDLLPNSLSLKLPRKFNTSAVDLGTEKSDSAGSYLDSKLKANGSASAADPKGGIKWSCSSCTFYNAANKHICDMCGRSKNPGPEATPLVSGGRECPQCTLVNKKESENCTACGASLKDSPTYI